MKNNVLKVLTEVFPVNALEALDILRAESRINKDDQEILENGYTKTDDTTAD